jgi:hypothetical protein
MGTQLRYMQEVIGISLASLGRGGARKYSEKPYNNRIEVSLFQYIARNTGQGHMAMCPYDATGRHGVMSINLM